MPPHSMPLCQALTRSVAAECGAARAVRFDPDARSYEAFGFGGSGTHLLDPLKATTLNDALAEMTERERPDRGGRLGVREIGEGVDLLHVYACRRTDKVLSYRAAYDNPYGRTALSYKRRLEHICTIDLRVIGGELVGLNENPSLADYQRRKHAERQAQRPEGAVL